MLRITVHETAQAITLQLEGVMSGPWLQELKRCWKEVRARHRRRRLRLDLTGVTSVDAEGRACLAGIYWQGADLVAADCLMKAVVDEISQGLTGLRSTGPERTLYNNS